MILDHLKLKVVWSSFQELSTVTKVTLVSTATVIVVRWMTRKRYKLPPGPTPLPLLGNILELKGVELMDKFEEWREKYGPVFTCYMGPKMMIILNDFKSMEEAFVKKGSDFSSRPYLYSLSVMTGGTKDIAAAPYGEAWKLQRKIASLALRQYLTGKQLEERVHETLEPIINRMLQEEGSFNPHRYLSLSVLNILHGLCFGFTLHLDDPIFLKLLSSFDALTDGIGNGFVEDFFPPLRLWPTQKFKELILDAVVGFNDYILVKLEEHKAAFDPETITSFTDSILQAQQQALKEEDPEKVTLFTDAHVHYTLTDVFSAGVDTSRQTLDWTILALAAYPEIQKKVQEEIDQVVGASIPGREHRAKLVYTEAVILEAMRLYYVVPVGLPHETIRDTNVCGYEVPAKSTIVTNNMAMMRDPAYFTDPLAFKPERFIADKEDGSGSKLVAGRYEGWAPFSMGHRSCIGESLAKLQLVYVIANLLQKLTFFYDGGEEGGVPDMAQKGSGITCVPKAYEVKVISRNI